MSKIRRMPAYVFAAVFFLAGFLAVPASAQISFGVSNNGTNTYVIDTRGQGAFIVRLAAIPAASGVTTCTVQVDASSDNVNFGSADVLASQSCTSRGAFISSNAAANWIRLNITQTGTGNVQFNANIDKATPPAGNQTTAANLTAVVNSAPSLAEKGARWVIFSGPTSGAQATATRAAGAAGVRHVADCVIFSAASTAAVAATSNSVALIDGISGGASTVRWAASFSAAAGIGAQLVAPHSICGLNIVGSPATAMTIEFVLTAAGAAEDVALTGYDVQ